MNSFFGWIGGKKLLREDIVKRFPKNFGRYIEVFGGAGWVLFHKDKHANFEVYNDANGDLVNLYRCVKYHCEELQRELSFFLNSRELFEDFVSQYRSKGLTDIQRAARFFILIKTSYGCKGGTFGCVKRDTTKMIDYLAAIQDRLSKVVIENKDFEALIKTHDKLDALIFADPPYYGTEKYYAAEFSKEDHIRLRDTLKNIKGKFILTYNDCEFIRELYKDFTIEEIVRSNNLALRSTGADKHYKEIIIKNY